MAAVQLTMNTPTRDTSESTPSTRRRYLAPTSGAPTWYRIFSAAELYLERADVADASARGSAYETLPAGVVHVVAIRRGEFGLSCGSASTAVEVTALSRIGDG
jgi:hypothetical protein